MHFEIEYVLGNGVFNPPKVKPVLFHLSFWMRLKSIRNKQFEKKMLIRLSQVLMRK